MSVEQAIAKVRTEMTQNIANTYIQVVGGFLLDHLGKQPQDAAKILSADKTIDKSLEEMWKQAKKKQVKQSAMFTPQEGFTIVIKYFGIVANSPETAQASAPIASAKVIHASSSGSKESSFDIKLEDLLA